MKPLKSENKDLSGKKISIYKIQADKKLVKFLLTKREAQKGRRCRECAFNDVENGFCSYSFIMNNGHRRKKVNDECVCFVDKKVLDLYYGNTAK